MTGFAIAYLATFGLFALVAPGARIALGCANTLAGLGLAVWVLA
jgi:hypothetical protein